MHSEINIPNGTAEAYGSSLNLQEQAISVIESIYHEFGFDPLQTPVLEFSEIFKGHAIKEEKGFFSVVGTEGEEIMLRYDLTLPLARFIRNHPDIILPLKRYQIATVFRNKMDNCYPLREFTQCDVDIVGSRDLISDSEIVTMAYEGLSRLGFSDFVVSINHRKIVDAILEKACLENEEDYLKFSKVLSDIKDLTQRLLLKHGHSEDPVYQLYFKENVESVMDKHNLPQKAREVIETLISFKGKNGQKLEELKGYLSDFPDSVRAVDEILEILSYLEPDVKERIVVNPTLIREFNYYTGLMIEGDIPGVHNGEVIGGGRYDNLVKELGGEDSPAVGMSFILENVVRAMIECKIEVNLARPSRVMVVSRSEGDKLKLLKFAQELRRKGLEVDFVITASMEMDDVVEYAKKRGFSYLALGANSSEICFKNLVNGDGLPDIMLATT